MARADYDGRNLHFGVREHAMGAVVGGLAAHGGPRPFGATFLVFTDYVKPAIRLSAIMGLPVLYVFTHDSIGLGEDGPTHQPVEQLASLRATPGLTVLRPADAHETAAAVRTALELDGPVALVLSRQKLPVLDPDDLDMAGRVVADDTDAVLVATGSEVAVALAARERLAADGVTARVVSLPSWELFRARSAAERHELLPPDLPSVAVEAAASQGWFEFADEVVALDRFGASSAADALYEHLGITPRGGRGPGSWAARAPVSDVALEEHAFLSDGHSAALVTRQGSIDWLSFPRFDAPSVLGRLLDDDAGHLVVVPFGETEVTRRYLDDTLVLEMTLSTTEGTAALTDALALRPGGARARGHRRLAAARPGPLGGAQRPAAHAELQARWVALDRAIALADVLAPSAEELGRWHRERDRIRTAILERGVDPQTGAFTQAFGSDVLDASALRIPIVGFLPGDDPRVRATIAAVRERLTDDEGFVYRYEDDGGLEGQEGSFLPCTFWLAHAQALAGDAVGARATFALAAGVRNDVDPLAEEYGGGALLGNLPQAFGHIGLVTAAAAIAACEARQG